MIPSPDGAALPGPGTRRACLMLLAAALFWGSGNVANKTVLHHIDPYTALALRCALATLVIAPLAVMERGAGWCRKGRRSAVVVSVLFGAALFFQQIAYLTTTVTNASFLVNAASILTPMVAWLCLSERPQARILAAGALTLLGAGLMGGAFSTRPTINFGDVACLVSALFYAGWMVALGQHAIRHGQPFFTSLVQFAVTAAIMGTVAGATQTPTLSGITGAWPELLLLGVVSTAAAFALQTFAQRSVGASTAAVLGSGESIFGALGAYIVLGERTGPTGLFGAALIMTAILIAATSARGGTATAPETGPATATGPAGNRS